VPVIRKSLPWARAGAGVGVAAATMLICSAVPAGAVSGATTSTQTGNPAAPAQSGSSISTTPASATPFTAKSTPAKAAKPAAKSAKGAYSYDASDFILRLRASAVQAEADIPHPLVPGFGYSAVNLEKNLGAPVGKCEVFGAGFYLTDIVQEGILENSGPPDAGNKGGGVFNPVESKDTAPNLSPGSGNLNSRKPGLRSVTDGSRMAEIPHEGNGPRWTAKCDSDSAGKGVGNWLDAGGVEGFGSTSTGAVNRSTGEYTGVARSYVAGLGPAGQDVVHSWVSIKHMPKQKPVVSYRIGVNGTPSASGTNVPYGDLTKAFNEAMQSNHGATAAVGPTGNLLALMGPTESESENGGRYIINFPFFEVQQGLEARKGGAGHNQRVRLVNIDYEGLYEGGAIKEPGTGNHT
jgi:hypothetical protein